jgi:hypothetical protein
LATGAQDAILPHMNPNLHRLAIVVAVLALLLVISGAIVTTQAPDLSFKPIHQHAAEGIGTLAIILAIWLIVTTPGARVLGGLLIAMTAATSVLGALPENPNSGTFHATAAQILFALTWAAVIVTSRGWTEGKDLVPDQGWPSLRSLAVVMPVFVLIQVGLGAAFRHKAMGVMPHLVGAMIVALLILCECLFVSQPYPKHGTLRPASNLLLGMTCAQVFLGIAVFTVLLINTASPMVLLLSTAAHVSVGAITLAAALGLSLQIRHNVFKPAPEPE